MRALVRPQTQFFFMSRPCILVVPKNFTTKVESIHNASKYIIWYATFSARCGFIDAPMQGA